MASIHDFPPALGDLEGHVEEIRPSVKTMLKIVDDWADKYFPDSEWESFATLEKAVIVVQVFYELEQQFKKHSERSFDTYERAIQRERDQAVTRIHEVKEQLAKALGKIEAYELALKAVK